MLDRDHLAQLGACGVEHAQADQLVVVEPGSGPRAVSSAHVASSIGAAQPLGGRAVGDAVEAQQQGAVVAADRGHGQDVAERAPPR